LPAGTILLPILLISTPGVNFINVILAAFTRANPESVQIQSSRQYHLRLLGSAHIKAVYRMLMKLSPGVNFINIKCANFLNETLFRQLFSSYMYVKKRRSYKKIRTFNVDEIDGSSLCCFTSVLLYFLIYQFFKLFWVIIGFR